MANTDINLQSNPASMIKGINSLKVLTLVIVLWFSFLYNIERLDINGEPLINIARSTSIVCVLIGLAFLAFPNLQQARYITVYAAFLLLELGLQLALGRMDFTPEQFFFGAVFIAISLYLVRLLSFHLQNVEEGMDTFVLTDGTSHILTYEEAVQRADEEIRELQQRNSPMSVIYCILADKATAFMKPLSTEDLITRDIDQMLETRRRQVELAKHIMTLTHVGDIIFEHRNGIAVCLLEADRVKAEPFVYRLHQIVRQPQAPTLWVGVATYPDDADSFESILEIAASNLRIYEREEDDLLSESVIPGDVRVGLRDRLRIENDAAWVNRMAYQSPTTRLIYRPIKRLIDIIGTGTALLLLSPVLLICMLMVYIGDGRPFFYGHERVGLGGKTFKMYKFRSMYRNAPAIPPQMITLPDGTTRLEWGRKDADDPRIFSTGRFLRKWSLDELPQLWNVLCGDMSLIGPRPSTLPLEKHTLMQTSRLTVKPGLTGLWQVSARDAQNFDERILWDLKYVQKMSLWLDILIVLRTFGAVIRRTGV